MFILPLNTLFKSALLSLVCLSGSSFADVLNKMEVRHLTDLQKISLNLIQKCHKIICVNTDLYSLFVKKYKTDILEKDFPIFDNLVVYSIKYFNDVIKAQKKYKIPNTDEKLALKALIKTLEKCNDEMSPEDIQTLIYSTGKENGYSEKLREWFKLIYEVIFGDENGPRMGFFISFFGVNETKELIINKIK